MRLAPALCLGLLVVASLAPSVSAHHPGSNKGLAGLLGVDVEGPIETNLVHRLPTVDARFAEWEATYPGLVERETIGMTSSGFPLYNLRVTDESVPFDAAPLSTGQKLRVYLDGGHHGNEFLGVELVMYYLEELITKAATGDAETLRFLRETELYATPIINVDGNFADARKNSNLVDPNRNYDFHWGEPGAGDSPTDFTYRGPEPFSESETRANADFQTRISPDVVVTMHTGIAEFYWPWGWTHDPSPDDAFFTSLEKPFEDATNGRVDAMQGAELYIVSGASDDWAYGVLGTPGFTFEVHEDQFIPVYGEPIPQLIEDQLAGLDFVVKNVKRLGAWVEPVRAGEAWELVNQGWGAAPNLTLTSGGQTWTLGPLAPGERVRVEAGDDLVVSYPVLFIDTSRTRTHDASALSAASAPPEVGVPAPGAALLLAGAALVALAMRRARA